MTYAVAGMLGSALPFLLVAHGERSVDSALAAIPMGFAPVATAAAAGAALPDERPTGRIVLDLVGAPRWRALPVGPGSLSGLGAQACGQAAILGATACYAASTVYLLRVVARPPLETAAESSLGAMVYLGLVPTAAANLACFHLMPRLGATRMSRVNFAVPVSGALPRAVLLGEGLAARQDAALAVIVGSAWVVTTSAGHVCIARRDGRLERCQHRWTGPPGCPSGRMRPPPISGSPQGSQPGPRRSACPRPCARSGAFAAGPVLRAAGARRRGRPRGRRRARSRA